MFNLHFASTNKFCVRFVDTKIVLYLTAFSWRLCIPTPVDKARPTREVSRQNCLWRRALRTKCPIKILLPTSAVSYRVTLGRGCSPVDCWKRKFISLHSRRVFQSLTKINTLGTLWHATAYNGNPSLRISGWEWKINHTLISASLFYVSGGISLLLNVWQHCWITRLFNTFCFILSIYQYTAKTNSCF